MSKKVGFNFFPFQWQYIDESVEGSGRNEIFQNIIRIYGWNEKNESVYVRVEDFTIPLWLEVEQDPSSPTSLTEGVCDTIVKYLLNTPYKYINAKPSSVTVEYKQPIYFATLVKDKTGVYKNKLFPYFKLNFKSTKGIKDFSWNVIKNEVDIPTVGKIKFKAHCSEPSITPVIKLLAIQDLPSSSWIRAGGIKMEDKETSRTHEYLCSYKHLKTHPDGLNLPIVYPKILSFDNEAYSSNETSMPKAEISGDKVFMIGCTLAYFCPKRKTKIQDKYLLVIGNCDPIEGVKIISVESEKLLLLKFTELICKKDPDVIMGYNIFGWDINYMLDRCKSHFHCEKDFRKMGCIASKDCPEVDVEWSSSAYGTQKLKYIEADGRVFIDLLPYVQRSFKLSNYRLETVCDEFLKTNKDPLKAKDMFKMWRKGNPADIAVIGKYCIVEGSEITTKYENIKIEDMNNIDSNVLSWSENKDGLIYSPQTKFFNNGQRDCIELEFIDGTKIQCTPDHKVLTSTNEWIEAKDIIIGETKIKSGLIFPSVNKIQEWKECSSWKLLDICSTDTIENYNKSLIFMRFLGYLLTDGTLSEDRATIFMGSIYDTNDMIEDLKILCDCDRISYRKDRNTYRIHIPRSLSKKLLNIHGIPIGRRCNSSLLIPSFINNCPKPLIREFLGGLFGGDGGSPSISKKDNKVSCINFVQTKTQQLYSSLLEHMNTIQNMLNLFGIQSVIHNPVNVKSSREPNFCIQLNIPIPFTTVFEKEIGFRYCGHKMLRLRSICSYLNYRNKLNEELSDFISELRYQKENNKKQSLQKVYDNCIKMEKFKNKFIPSISVCKSRIKNKEQSLYKTKNLDRYKPISYLREINAIHFFENKNNEYHTYALNQTDEMLSTINLTCIGRHNIGIKNVYDIEIKDTHSYISNGIVVHNCTQDSYVVYLLFEKLLIWFDLIESATANGVPLVYLYTQGQQIKMYAQVLKYAIKNNIMVQSKGYVVKEDESYVGATVTKPKAGLYKNILPFDFASLYPSIIMAHNIDMSSLVLDDSIPDECCHIFDWNEHQNCYCELDPENNNPKRKPAAKNKDGTVKRICAHYRYRFLKASVVGKGVIPTLLESLLKARKDTRKVIAAQEELADNYNKYIKFKQTNPDDEYKYTGPTEKNKAIFEEFITVNQTKLDLIEKEANRLEEINLVLDKRQLAYKVSANSMYGAMGVKQGKLPFLPGAMCVTYTGRESIKKASRFLEEECGGKVIYNDTDSAYTYFEELEGKSAPEIWAFAADVVKRVATIFPPPMKLEFEDKLYSKFLILTKKRYMAKTMDEDGTESKKLTKRGVVLTRRDNCRFLRDVYERAVVYILQNADQLTQIKPDWSSKDVIQHPNVIELLDILWDGFQQLFTLRYGYKDFVITKGLTKETYKSKRPPVHVSVAMKMRERGIEVPANSRIEYILLDNGIPYDKNELQNDKAVDVWHYAENKEELDIDYLYYFRSQFMKPLSELLKVVTRQTDIIESHFKYRIQKNYYINAMKSLYKTVIVYEEKECTWENTSLEEFIYKYSGMPIYYKPFFERGDVKEEIQKISNHIKQEVQEGAIIYPRIDQVFRALSLSVKSIKVLLIGQDPYHNGNACGLAFSIENKDADMNPSLKNIIKECENCYFDMVPDSGDLSLWTSQGVMLLNTALTVRKGEANSHSKIWNKFTTLLLEWMISQHPDMIGLLWGRHAIDVGKHIDKKVCTSHPSPLGADKTCGEHPPFTGSKCFRKVNALLSENNVTKIQWENRPKRVMLK